MNKTSIEWVVNPDGTPGYTWNPITGCLHNCEYCYARKIAMRFQGNFEPKFHPERLDQPVKIKKPSTIFVGSMADVFGNWIPDIWIEQILEIIENCPQHIFLTLTKNGSNICFAETNNVWYGQTHTGRKEDIHWGIRILHPNYISFEPLLGDHIPCLSSVNWIIIGALNKNGKPCYTKKEWVLSLVKQADSFKIPVFVKDSLYELYPELPKRRELPYINLGQVAPE